MSHRHLQDFQIIFLAAIFFIAALPVHGDEGQILSVTPPLFQLSAKAGDIWQSSVKVVNANAYPLTVFTEIVNFKAEGESGQGTFLPLLGEDPDKTTLATWIHAEGGPYTIAPEQSSEIPFYIEVPKDAAPGGHYAAILVSTQPPVTEGEKQPTVLTTQAVTSLFFVRVEGDVVEKGDIREFRTVHTFLEKPDAEFSLRFENKGNVHLQPLGNIVITNMWGTERGNIPINYQTHFGNVLPNSIRDFRFTWQSDFRITDIGLYKAIATLAYGDDGVKSTTATAYFWIIPVKATLITIAVLAVFISLIVWMVKSYVRRMLTLAGVDVTAQRAEAVQTVTHEVEVPKPTRKQRITYRDVSAPLRDGVLDLRRELSTVDESIDVIKTVGQFIVRYKTFFISVCVLIGIFVVSVLYISRATDTDQEYTVIINEGDTQKTFQGEDIP